MTKGYLKSTVLIALCFTSIHSFALDVNTAFYSLDKDSNGTLSEAEAGEDALLH